MKELIKINGLKEIEGMKFHDIEGGFGQGKKAMLVKEIANIHARQEPHINELINNNIKRFKDGVDIINLLSSEDFKIVVDDLGLRTSNRQKYSYLLSERGYSKLLKILEDDVAWEQYEKLVDGYFNLRSELPQLSKELQAIFALDGKQQKLELEWIINLIGGVVPKSSDLFIESKYQHIQNKQFYKEYLLTRDGFSLLVMRLLIVRFQDVWRNNYLSI